MADLSGSQWRAWKTQLVPVLYDWFVNHRLVWPSQACRWGPLLSDSAYTSRQLIYLSEQTNPEADDPEPPKLLVCEAELLKARVASSEVVTAWTEAGRCPYITDVKTIVHPGEVNKIRELPQHPTVVVTHTDAPELFVWNTSTQPNMTRQRGSRGWGESIPDVTLVGHEQLAQFPLATSRSRPMVASGGTDQLVLLWDLTDATREGGILESAKQQVDGEEGGPSEGCAVQERAPVRTTQLKPRVRLVGHTDTVEDVVFMPGSHTRLASVGDDRQLLLWDTTAGPRPVASIQSAHGPAADVHCVDWSGLQEHLLVTGAADGSLRVWDVRKLPSSSSGTTAAAAADAAALRVFAFHRDAIMRVEWHATAPGVLASGGEDNLVAVWSLDRAPPAAAAAANGSNRGGGAAAAAGGAAGSSSSSKEPPPELMFKHVGHKGGKVVDFQWDPHDPWLMMSVSEHVGHAAAAGAAAGTGGLGGTSEAAGGSGRGLQQQAHLASSSGAAAAEGSDAELFGRPGGGTLQIWRMMDLLYLPEQEALAELEAHKDWILHGRQPPQLAEAHQQLGMKVEPTTNITGSGATAADEQQQRRDPRQSPQQQRQPPTAAAGAAAEATPAASGVDSDVKMEG